MAKMGARSLVFVSVAVPLAVSLAAGLAWADGQGSLSQKDLWDSWPFKDKEKYLSHETCGEKPDRRREGDKWVDSTMLCLKVSVDQGCHCRTFNATYRKKKGDARYTHFSVGNNVDITCTTPRSDACKKQLADEAQRDKARTVCKDNIAVQIVQGKPGVKLVCDKYPSKDEDYCRCRALAACNAGPSDAEGVALWRDNCKSKFGIDGKTD